MITTITPRVPLATHWAHTHYSQGYGVRFNLPTWDKQFPTLEELAGWPYDEDNDRPVITESDVEDWEHEQAERDAEWLR